MPSRECVMMHIGQAGVQISQATWELFCLEHGIFPNGCKFEGHYGNESNGFETFFSEKIGGTYVPRAILMDLEPTCVDEVRTGSYRHLFHPDFMITGKEDAANNYARGYYSIGRELIDVMVDRTRRIVEECNGLQGFLITRSLGGGTGSGFTSLLIHKLANYFGKRPKVCLDVFPSPQIATSVVEPYNAIFTTHSSMQHADISFILDNQAMYEICRYCLDINHPTYTNLNRLAAQVISSLTASIRFSGSINVELLEFQTNLVPYPRIHFPVITYAPIISAEKAYHERFSVNSLVGSLFDPYHQLVTCDTRLGKFIAMSLLFRGDVTPNDVGTTLGVLKGNGAGLPGKIKFVDWAPTGFKVGLCHQPSIGVPGGDMAPVPRSVLGLINTTAIQQPWRTLQRKFAAMYSRRAFVHWYVGEGMEESEFVEARDNMKALQQDYTEIAKDNNNGGSKRSNPKKHDMTVKGLGIGPGKKNGPAKNAKLR